MQFASSPTGGKAKKESAAAAARRERAQREQQRVAADAAAAVRLWWLAARARRRTSAELRAAYEAEVRARFATDDTASAAALLRMRPTRVPLPSGEGVFWIVAKLMRCGGGCDGGGGGGGGDGDGGGVPDADALFVMRLVSMSAARAEAEQSYLSMAVGSAHAPAWLAATRRLVRRAVRLMVLRAAAAAAAEGGSGGSGGGDRVAAAVALKLLLDLLLVRNWAFLRGSVPSKAAAPQQQQQQQQQQQNQQASSPPPAEVAALLARLRSDVFPHLAEAAVSAGLFEAVAAAPAAAAAAAAAATSPAAGSSSGGGGGVAEAGLAALAGRCVAAGGPSAAAAFVSQALCVSGLCGVSTPAGAAAAAGAVAALSDAAAWELIFEAAAQRASAAGWNAALLGNLLALGSGGRGGAGAAKAAAAPAAWARAVCRLVPLVPPRSEMTRLLEAERGVAAQMRHLFEADTVTLLFPGLLALPPPPLPAAAAASVPPSSTPASPAAAAAAAALRRESSIFRHLREKRALPAASAAPPAAAAVAAALAAAAAAAAVDAGWDPDGCCPWRDPGWLPACRVYNGLVYSWDPTAAVNCLASHHGLAAALWRHIEAHVWRMEEFVEGGGGCAAADGRGDVLLLFVHSYDSLLAVTDDREFYELQQPFPLATVARMVPLLVKLVFRLLWEGLPAGGGGGGGGGVAAATPFEKQAGALPARLLVAARRLLQKLRRRDARRPFCPERAWAAGPFAASLGFRFADVLGYLGANAQQNPFDTLFGTLRDLSSEMQRSDEPLERQLGDVFEHLRCLFSGLHDLYHQGSAAAAAAATAGGGDGDGGGGGGGGGPAAAAPAASTVVDADGLVRYQAVVRALPFVVGYEERLEYQRFLIERDRRAHRAADVRLPVTVRRGRVLEDCLREFHRIDAQAEAQAEGGAGGGGKTHLKAQLHVRFLNAEGVPEAGIDEGGLFKECLEIVLREAFSPELGFFSATETQRLHPNPLCTAAGPAAAAVRCAKNDFVFRFYEELDGRAGSAGAGDAPPPPPPTQRFYKFVGRVLAKAVYEGVVVELPFADFFLNTFLGEPNYVEDMASLDAELHRHVTALKDVDDVTALDLTFTVDDPASPRYPSPVPLVPHGERMQVTNANLSAYLSLYASYKLTVRFAEQSAAFLAGFQDIIPEGVLGLFNRAELQQLISGKEGSFDILELRPHARHEGGGGGGSGGGGGGGEGHPVVAMLWEVLAGFDDEEKGAFLRFVTSSARPPLLGFGHLNPPFTVKVVPLAGCVGRLPSSSTCFNLLCLPAYESREQLADRLRYAISSGTGFELS